MLLMQCILAKKTGSRIERYESLSKRYGPFKLSYILHKLQKSATIDNTNSKYFRNFYSARRRKFG